MSEAQAASGKDSKKQADFLITEKRNEKGEVISVVPYRLHSINRSDYYEVPKGSGNWMNLHSKPVSAVDRKMLVEKFPIAATPLTVEQVMIRKREEEAQLDARIAAKKAELEAAEEKASKPKPAETISEARELLAKAEASAGSKAQLTSALEKNKSSSFAASVGKHKAAKQAGERV